MSTLCQDSFFVNLMQTKHMVKSFMHVVKKVPPPFWDYFNWGKDFFIPPLVLLHVFYQSYLWPMTSFVCVKLYRAPRYKQVLWKRQHTTGLIGEFMKRGYINSKLLRWMLTPTIIEHPIIHIGLPLVPTQYSCQIVVLCHVLYPLRLTLLSPSLKSLQYLIRKLINISLVLINLFSYFSMCFIYAFFDIFYYCFC